MEQTCTACTAQAVTMHEVRVMSYIARTDAELFEGAQKRKKSRETFVWSGLCESCVSKVIAYVRTLGDMPVEQPTINLSVD